MIDEQTVMVKTLNKQHIVSLTFTPILPNSQLRLKYGRTDQHSGDCQDCGWGACETRSSHIQRMVSSQGSPSNNTEEAGKLLVEGGWMTEPTARVMTLVR